jgi:hypothetical protein
MKLVYRADNLPLANLLADRLRDAGVLSHILNTNAVGALGDVPFLDSQPQIWVANPHHAELARTIIQTYLATPEPAPWGCAACGESNPGSFDICWQCMRPET